MSTATTTAAPVPGAGDDVRITTAREAIRICRRRAESLYDNQQFVAANEAEKCAFAIEALLGRDTAPLRAPETGEGGR